MTLRNFVILGLFAGIIFGFFFWNRISQESQSLVVIKRQKIFVEVAKTEEERRRGLSGREFLGENQGMLFLFPQKGRYSFWMKEMKFNLDFVFLDGERIVDLAMNIPFPQKDQAPQFVRSEKDFDKVLELNAGMVQQLGVKIGDEAAFLLK